MFFQGRNLHVVHISPANGFLEYRDLNRVQRNTGILLSYDLATIKKSVYLSTTAIQFSEKKEVLQKHSFLEQL